MLSLFNPFDSFFQFQREIDRMFDQFWADLPARTINARSSFSVNAGDEDWRIDVPVPGIDPKNVTLEVAGNTLTVRAHEPKSDRRQEYRYEQTITIPQFLDLDKIAASHRHGMLELTIPLRDSEKPRRIQINARGEERAKLESGERELVHS